MYQSPSFSLQWIAVTVCGLVRPFPCYTNITVTSNFLGMDFVIKIIDKKICARHVNLSEVILIIFHK